MKPKKRPYDPSNKRTPFQRELDLREFARMAREGLTQQECREWVKLNRPYHLTKSQISYDFKDLMERWRAESKAALDDRIAKQLAAIDAQEAAAWRAWRESVGEMTEVQQEQVDGEAGKPKGRAIVKKWKSAGDPRFLNVITNCIESRNRILGLNKQKFELSGPDGGPMEVATDNSDFDLEHIDAFLKRHYEKRHDAKPSSEGKA